MADFGTIRQIFTAFGKRGAPAARPVAAGRAAVERSGVAGPGAEVDGPAPSDASFTALAEAPGARGVIFTAAILWRLGMPDLPHEHK